MLGSKADRGAARFGVDSNAGRLQTQVVACTLGPFDEAYAHVLVELERKIIVGSK